MRSVIRFVRNGQINELETNNPTKTVLNYLRYDAADTGTKEGCAEGDCGACTVILGELNPQTNSINYRAVNACILFLPMLDGKELITVEDLKNSDGTPHPVQQAMVDANATQCGFCTPGFVMSLVAERHNDNRSGTEDLNDVLAGNLCRCTGYGTILAAGQKAATNSDEDIISKREADTRDALKILASDPMLSWQLGTHQFFAPTSSNELADILAQHPDATLVAGATDVGLWVTKQHRDLQTVIDLGKVQDIKNIDEVESGLLIGAGVTYSKAWPALKKYDADLGELVRRIASTQIRNSGTIGGNIANGSPIGDMPPALIALNAELVLQSQSGTRKIPLEEFFVEYGKQDLQFGEFVKAVLLPNRKPEQRFATYKISKRFDQDISAVCGAYSLTLSDGKVTDIRICYGGMAGTPLRAAHAEQALLDKSWSEASVQDAMNAITKDYTPLTDMRASAEYRMTVAQNLLRKFFIETTDATAGTRLVGGGAHVSA